MLRKRLALEDIHVGDRVKVADIMGIYGVKIVLEDFHTTPTSSLGEGTIATINGEPRITNWDDRHNICVLYREKNEDADWDENE